MTIKKLVLGCPDPEGVAVPAANMIIEPPHLRNDKSRPGDIYIIGGALHQLDSMMDVVISSSLTQSCLLPSSKSFDFVLRKAENMKFTKDLRSSSPIQKLATKRLIPLAINQHGLRGLRLGRWL